MAILSTRAHGMLDYGMGVVLLITPSVLGFSGRGPAAWVPMALGAVKLIPMPIHLMLDALSGLILAASPWIFGFANMVWLRHLVLGLLEFGSSLITGSISTTDGLPSSQAG